MQLERETLVEIGVSVVAVVLFVLAVAYVGATYGGNDLSNQGATLLVGAVVGFVLLMTAVGIALERR
ncbi:DUF7472 family protein [Halorarius litoreus]|uniref:DUF7472 family protein n=1 Tax=Halorarius litoreus TaxID=2962676 RepID=UPI0020CD6EA7|nr:hypothetical protein [Halorarius litoreus]